MSYSNESTLLGCIRHRGIDLMNAVLILYLTYRFDTKGLTIDMSEAFNEWSSISQYLSVQHLYWRIRNDVEINYIWNIANFPSLLSCRMLIKYRFNVPSLTRYVLKGSHNFNLLVVMLMANPGNYRKILKI